MKKDKMITLSYYIFGFITGYFISKGNEMLFWFYLFFNIILLFYYKYKGVKNGKDIN